MSGAPLAVVSDSKPEETVAGEVKSLPIFAV
jgi:hypothetical protein